jgi:hypothetical protein
MRAALSAPRTSRYRPTAMLTSLPGTSDSVTPSSVRRPSLNGTMLTQSLVNGPLSCGTNVLIESPVTEIAESPSATNEAGSKHVNEASSKHATTETNSPSSTPETSQADSEFLLDEVPALTAWRSLPDIERLKEVIAPNQAYRCHLIEDILFIWSAGPRLLVMSRLLRDLLLEFVEGQAFRSESLHILPMAEAISEMEQLLHRRHPEAQHRQEDIQNIQRYLKDILSDQVNRMCLDPVSQCQRLLKPKMYRSYATSVLGLFVGEDCYVETPSKVLTVLFSARFLAVQEQADTIKMIFYVRASMGQEPPLGLVSAAVDVTNFDSLKLCGIHFTGDPYNARILLHK